MEPEEKEKGIVPTSSKSLRRYEENIEIVTKSPAEEEIDPYTYLQVIWRHRKIGFIFFSVVVGTALLISILTKPMYLAQSTVEIAFEKPKIVGFPEVVENDIKDPEFFNTQKDLIVSRSMAESVLSRFKLWNHPEFNVSQLNFNPISILSSYINRWTRALQSAKNGNIKGESYREKMMRDNIIDTFLSRVAVFTSLDPGSRGSPGSRIITIGFKAYNPIFATKMADAIADTFVQWSLDRRLEATRNARKFLERQLAEVKVDLEKSEAALHQFSVDNNIVSLDANQNLILGQLQELDRSLAQATAEKTAKESLYKSVESGNPNTILEVINDPLIQGLKSDYNKLLVEYSDLSALFRPEYPPLKKLQARIEGIRARINEETKRRVEAIKTDYQTATRKEELLKERAQEQEKSALALSEKTIQYRILEREVQSNKSIYESLLQRFKETDVTGDIRSSSIQVLDHASIPRAPFEPNIPRNLLLAVLAGLIGAIGIAFGREFFNRTIRTPEEISEKMRLPVLGAILNLTESNNKYYKKLRAPIEKLYLVNPRSPFSEAIRTLRASIVLSSQDHSLRSILITSCWPGEGKTTIAANLALSLAYGPNRVLLVEADLRHPSLGKIFGIDESKPGLSNYLMFNSELSEVIHSTDILQLFVLPCGSVIPSNPSELLHSEEMKQLLGRLRGDFDYLVVDSSPAIGFADSLMLSTIADTTVIVSSAGITTQKDISYLVKQLSRVNGRFLGVVMNRLELGRDAYYYDHYYDYYKDKPTDKKIEIKKISSLSHQEEFDESGELKDTSYPNLLISFQRRKKTGVLDIDSQLKLRIYFLEGFPVFVAGGDDNKTFLGSIALAEGRIKQEDYKRILDNIAQTKKKIGEVLIDMGFISPHELDRLLELQVKEKLINGFECTTGTYSFRAVNDFVGNVLIYKVNPLYVIHEGVKRFGDAREIERKFFTVKELAALSGLNLNERLNKVKNLIEIKEMRKEPFKLDGLMVSPEPELIEKLKDIGFSPKEFRFLQSLRESKGLEDILSHNGLSRGEVLKLLYFLNLVGFVEIKIRESELENYRRSL